MPGKYRNYGRRYVYAKRIQRAWKARRFRRRRRRYAAGPIKYKVKKLQRIVYNNLQPKWLDKVTPPTGTSAGGLITGDWAGFENIAQGNDHDARDGNRIVVKSISIKGNIQMATGDVFNEFRIVIFLVPCPESSPPAVNQILETGDLYSFYKKDSKVHYKILYDKNFQMSSQYAEVGTVTPVKLCGMCYPNYIHWEHKVKFPKGLSVWYKDATANTPTKNHVYMLTISDSLSSIPSGHPTLGMYVRLNFIQ